jgi:hypothetical protein
MTKRIVLYFLLAVAIVIVGVKLVDRANERVHDQIERSFR